MQVFIKVLVGAQVSFLLASQSAINCLYSFEVEFCISSFFPSIQSFPFVVGYCIIILRCFPYAHNKLIFFVVEFTTTSFNPSLQRLLSNSFLKCSSRFLLEELKYLSLLLLEVQIILHVLLKWTFAFLHSSQLFKHLVVA